MVANQASWPYLAAGCDHYDHVRTQLPYALTTGVAVAAVILYLIAGFWI